MPTRAEKELGWKRVVSFDQLVRDMVEADLKVRRSCDVGTVDDRFWPLAPTRRLVESS